MRADSSFLTTQLFGAAAFAASDAEVVHAAAEVAAGRAPSFLAYMIARGFQLSRPFDFTADLGATQRLYTRFAVTPPRPASTARRSPTPQSVTTAEDTAEVDHADRSDPDGDAADVHGRRARARHADRHRAEPHLHAGAPTTTAPTRSRSRSPTARSISATATVSITVTAVDDPPVTTASGTLAYTENDPPTAIAPALTVTDVDSANLTGATRADHAPATQTARTSSRCPRSRPSRRVFDARDRHADAVAARRPSPPTRPRCAP